MTSSAKSQDGLFDKRICRFVIPKDTHKSLVHRLYWRKIGNEEDILDFSYQQVNVDYERDANGNLSKTVSIGGDGLRNFFAERQRGARLCFKGRILPGPKEERGQDINGAWPKGTVNLFAKQIGELAFQFFFFPQNFSIFSLRSRRYLIRFFAFCAKSLFGSSSSTFS